MDSIFLLGNTTRCQKDFDCPPRCINGTCCYSLTKVLKPSSLLAFLFDSNSFLDSNFLTI